MASIFLGIMEEERTNWVLHGRLPIYTTIEEFKPDETETIIAEVNEALSIHILNLFDMEYLYWYRRGFTPIYSKTKEIRPEINNKVSVNLAGPIVDFNDGYFLTQPATYIPRKGKEEVAGKVSELNEYLYRSGKHDADNEVVDWFNTVGKADLFVRSVDDAEMPFEAYALDPRSVFVARSTAPGNKPVYAGYTVAKDGVLYVDVWDKRNCYRLKGTVTGKLVRPYKDYACTVTEIVEVLPNPIGEIPIVEYQYNSVWMSCFELAMPLMDAISQIQSDRLDGLDQAIQSLLVFYNCELGKDEEGKDITPSYVRAAGALFLKSIGENKADLKEIVTNLDQSQTQVLINNLYELIYTICGMPSTQGSFPGDSTGLAIELKDGWQICEMNARNTEDLFKKANRQFDRIITSILRGKGILDINLSDFELHFTRNELRAVQSKAQALQTMLAAGLHPTLALAKSGISADPVSDFEISKGYMNLRWGDPEAKEVEKKAKEDIPDETIEEGTQGAMGDGAI